jgi:hypothetical protein
MTRRGLVRRLGELFVPSPVAVRAEDGCALLVAVGGTSGVFVAPIGDAGIAAPAVAVVRERLLVHAR